MNEPLLFDRSRVLLASPAELLVPNKGWVRWFFALRHRTLSRWRSEADYKAGRGRRAPVCVARPKRRPAPRG